MSVEETPPLTGFSWIKPSNFIQTMARMNDMGHLLGGHSLTQAKSMLLNFWSKFRAIHPQHQLWAEERDLSKCIPIFLHGDEGVTYKKNGVLVLSFQGAIGFGSRSSQRARELESNLRAMGEGIPLNFLRTGFQTRMLVCVCPKEPWVQHVLHDCICFPT